MPRGNPKRRMMFRIDPELVVAVQALTSNVTAAVEDGLRLWLARAKRRKPSTARKTGPSRSRGTA
jgi:hypothetical protein